MNKTLTALGCVAASLLTAPFAFAQSQTTEVRTGDTVITVTVNSENVAFEEANQPRMFGGRVMVPLRGVIERLGGNVLYDKKSRTVTGGHAESGNQFRIRVGGSEALLNGKIMSLDAPPRIIGGTTYVPLRFVSEAMGADVEWDRAKRTVTIIGQDGNEAKVKTNP